MNIGTHTPISRFIALGLLAGLFIIIYFLVILPVQTRYANNRQMINGLGSELAIYQQIASSRDEVEKIFAATDTQDAQLGYYLNGATRALASAELQAYARDIIDSAKGDLISTQPIVRGESETERMVRVNVRMKGNIESMRQVLYRLSTGQPVLLIDEVLIRLSKSTLTQSDDEEVDDTLDVQFTLIGFVRESVLK